MLKTDPLIKLFMQMAPSKAATIMQVVLVQGYNTANWYSGRLDCFSIDWSLVQEKKNLDKELLHKEKQ